MVLRRQGVESARRWAARLRWQEAHRRWGVAALAGRLVEFSGDSGRLTAAMALVGEAQREGGCVAWIASGSSCFFAPDAQAAGVDLSALPVVRVGGESAPERVRRGCEAAELLLHEGAFSLVVLDFDGLPAYLPPPVEHRLEALVRAHRSTLCFLTDNAPGRPACGARIGLRLQLSWSGETGRRTATEARVAAERWERMDEEGEGDEGADTAIGDLLCLEALRERGGAGGWRFERECTLPPGLC